MERELIIKNLTNINTNLGKCIEMMKMTMTQNDQYILTIKRNEIKEPTIKKQASLSIVNKDGKETLGVGVFKKCTNLSTITVVTENVKYQSLNGVLYTKPVSVIENNHINCLSNEYRI